MPKLSSGFSMPIALSILPSTVLRTPLSELTPLNHDDISWNSAVTRAKDHDREMVKQVDERMAREKNSAFEGVKKR